MPFGGGGSEEMPVQLGRERVSEKGVADSEGRGYVREGMPLQWMGEA